MMTIRSDDVELSERASVGFTMSWDDGHPNDVRVAELLASYGIRGTFHVPVQNREGLPVMTRHDLRHVAQLHEIGSHTYSHCYLDTVPIAEAEEEIRTGKEEIEARLGRRVCGFCYPGGRFGAAHVRLVRESGFQYARTIENFRIDLKFDRWRMPTTLQLYPHTRRTYVRNFVRHGNWSARFGVLSKVVLRSDLLTRLITGIELAASSSGAWLVHVWGHSWELDQDGWDVLEECCQYISKCEQVVPMTNADAAGLTC